LSFVKTFPDGISRCSWVTSDQIYIDYHDQEWGNKVQGQRELFEAICLEGFQAGLSWLTILKRRPAFREAFSDFDLEIVADFDSDKIEELAQNPAIIRNRAKIESAVKNAKIILDQKIDLTSLLWSFAPNPATRLDSSFKWLVSTPESDLMSKELKRLGLSFVGSTTMHALMQACGMVQDHAPGCFRRP